MAQMNQAKPKLAERFGKVDETEEKTAEKESKQDKAPAMALLNDLVNPAPAVAVGIVAQRTVPKSAVEIPENASRMEDFPLVTILATETLSPNPVVGGYHFPDNVAYIKGKEFQVPYPVADFLTSKGVAAIIRNT